MSNTTSVDIIRSIRRACDEALDSASAGGNREHAFNLFVDDEELRRAEKIVCALNDDIDAELRGDNRERATS